MEKEAFSYFTLLVKRLNPTNLCVPALLKTNNMEGNNMNMAIWKLELKLVNWREKQFPVASTLGWYGFAPF